MRDWKMKTTPEFAHEMFSYCERKGNRIETFQEDLYDNYIIEARGISVTGVKARKYIIIDNLSSEMILTDSPERVKEYRCKFTGQKYVRPKEKSQEKRKPRVKIYPENKNKVWVRTEEVIVRKQSRAGAEIEFRLTENQKRNFCKVAEEYAKNFLEINFDMPLQIPIEINRRLTSTMAQFIHYKKGIRPIKIEISERFLAMTMQDPDGEEIILDVIEHELVHYALYMQGKDSNDGEEEFERTLAKLNIGPSGSTSPKRIFSRKPHVYYHSTQEGGMFELVKISTVAKQHHEQLQEVRV